MQPEPRPPTVRPLPASDGSRTPRAPHAPIEAEALRRLLLRSDKKGLLRLAGHLLAIVGTGALYTLALRHSPSLLLTALAAFALGTTLVTMFACMHEAVHRTAFKSAWLNDSVGFLAGLLSFYNSSFYRHYHGWHHRYTQLPGKDPERGDRIPENLWVYAVEMSGVTWWVGKLRTHFGVALGKTEPYGYLNDKNRAAVIRSVRLQLLIYGAAIVASLLLARPYFLLYWLVPMVLAQPLLRVILLAEHTGCSDSEGDDALNNTRTTHTVWPIRFLMWEMPYHAEHHRHPALPFFALADAHRHMAPHLQHVARRGYLGHHRDFLRAMRAKGAPPRAA